MTSPAFIPIFADCLRMLKKVLYAEAREGNQSVLIAGSGTMGWDAVGANLIERGDEAVSREGKSLCEFTEKYSSYSIPDTLATTLRNGKSRLVICRISALITISLEVYGAKVTQVKPPVGDIPK